jgi:hypothetical protein
MARRSLPLRQKGIQAPKPPPRAALDSAPVSNAPTPDDDLAQHPFTAQLKCLGITDTQLEAMHFPRSNRGLPFDQWSVRASGDTPDAAVPLLKLYCALKWLLLGDPPRRGTEMMRGG